MFQFAPATYGTAVAELVDFDRLNDLGPGSPNRSVRSRLQSLTPEDLFPSGSAPNRSMAACCLSGLWLWHDFLDESHTLSQSIETTSGSYWHGIMHRREPDYSNSKYWFHRVGDHAIFDALATNAAELAVIHNRAKSASSLTDGPPWDPFAFVDLCQAAARGTAEDRQLCQEIARVEWALLFDYCHQSAQR
ncbi:MAG: hypothetical protein KDA60_05560 [Planctomycetales bacterium]|nr:hypothetical protein [Planctomycetales bacterium]